MPAESPAQEQNELIGTLLTELKELKNMVASVVKDWEPSASINKSTHHEQSIFEGAWINKESDTHLYAKVINGELVGPYCYSGNTELTAVYYNWRRTGEYWFASFGWLSADISGFAFLRQDTLDKFSGAWWTEDYADKIRDAPPPYAGVPMSLERQKDIETPKWALEFFAEVREKGLESILAEQRKNSRTQVLRRLNSE